MPGVRDLAGLVVGQLTRLTGVTGLTCAGQRPVSGWGAPGWESNAATAGLTLGTLAHAPPVVWVIALVAFGLWRIDLELCPFAPCRVCKGSGQSRGSRAGAYGLCPHGPRRIRFTGRRAAARHLRRRGQ